MTENIVTEQCAVSFYLIRKGKTAKEILEEFINVYQDSVLAFSTVKSWIAKFRRGRDSFENETSSGAPITVTTQGNIDTMQKIALENQAVTGKENEETLSINHERVLFILHEKLGPSKVSVRWVAKLLTK